MEQELAEQRTQLEKMEDKLQQTEDQEMQLKVNRQARKTHFGRNLAAKEEVRKEREDKLQQTEDQKMQLEVNMQARKTQIERDIAAKEEVHEEKRRGKAKQLRDIKTKLDEEREQKQAEQRTQLEEMKDELQQTEDQKIRLEVKMQAWKTQFERDLAAKEKVREEDLAHIEIMVEDVTHSKTKRRIGQIAQKAGNVSIKKYRESYILKEQGGLKGYI